jgi:hypothetical protein
LFHFNFSPVTFPLTSDGVGETGGWSGCMHKASVGNAPSLGLVGVY